MTAAPRFIADVMLGSLAKWLRIMGFDTLYDRRIADSELVRIARQEDRIILTRDGAICRSKRSGPCLPIVSEDVLEQVREVVAAFGLAGAPHTGEPRCPRCNGKLAVVGPEAVAGTVPDHILRAADAFARCGACGKVYWQGTHKRAIDGVVAAILDDREVRRDR